MTTAYLREVLLKDLEAVRAELHAYSREEDLWTCPSGLPNSSGNLVMHVTGNLCHFIGATLGGTAYVRDREAEFTALLVPRAELEVRLDRAIEVVRDALDGMDEDRLGQEYPLEIDGARLPTEVFLLRLVSHLAFHLGQINYHRRIVTANTTELGSSG
jgi:hypothetical protein